MLEHEHQETESTAQTIRQAVRFLRVLWHRRIVVMGTLALCGMLGGLYYATATRIYESEAQLLVVDTSRENSPTSMTGSHSDIAAMATYEKLISSPLVLQSAATLLDAPVRSLFGSQDPEVLAEDFSKELNVRGVRQTNLLELSFRSPHQEASAAVVAAIIQAYATFMDESHRGTANSIVDLLQNEKEEVDRKIEVKQAEFLAVRQKVGDLGIKEGGKTMHPLVERAIQLNSSLIETQKKRLLLAISYQSLTEAIEAGHNIRQSLVAIEETLGKEAFLDSMGLGDRDKQTRVSVEKQLLEDRAQLETLQEYYGPNHPKVVERTRKIEQMQGYLAQFDLIGSSRSFGGDDAQLANTVTNILNQRLESAERQEEWFQKSFEKAKQESIGLTSDISQLDIVEHDLNWLRQLRNTLLNQIASVDLRQENGGVRTTVVREPVVAEKPVSPRLSLTILAVLAGGLASGIGIVFVIDTLDDRARSPEELQTELNLPTLATIGILDEEEEFEDGVGLETAHMWNTSDDAAAESFRTIRTVLVMGTEDSERIAVTSADPGDGKTTIACNLAIAYQQAGKRVLIIDADMRKPGLTKLIDRRGQVGLSDILRGTEEVAEQASRLTTQTGSVPIDIIPAGRRPPNPGELLLGDRFAELLAWADGEYDQVIVDAPPVLAGTDAAAVGRLCDGLMLVVRPEKNRRRVLIKAVEMLRMFGVTLFGTIVNAVGLEEMGYGYGYGSGYGYGYGDEYGLDDDEEYGDEEEEETYMRAA